MGLKNGGDSAVKWNEGRAHLPPSTVPKQHRPGRGGCPAILPHACLSTLAPEATFFSCKISAKPVVRMLSYSSIDKHASAAHSNPDFTCAKVLFVRDRWSIQVPKWPCLIYRPLQTLQGDD